MPNEYLEDQEKTRRDILNGTGLNGEEVASQYLAGLNPQLPKPMENPSREQILKAALKLTPEPPPESPQTPDAASDLSDYVAKTPSESKPDLVSIINQNRENNGPSISFDPEAFSQALYAAGTRTALPPRFFERKLGREKEQTQFEHQKELLGLKAKKAGKEDFSSPSARAEQTLFLKANPWADAQQVQYMTHDQLKAYAKFGQTYSAQAETERSHKAGEQQKDEALEERKFANRMSFKLKELGMDQHRADQDAEQLAKHQTFIQKDLIPFHANLEDMYGQLPKEVSSKLLAAGPDTDLTGTFDDYAKNADLWKQRIASKVPLLGSSAQVFFGDSPEAIANRRRLDQSWQTFRNTIAHKLIGGNQTSQEAERVEKMFGDKMFETPAARLSAMEMFRNLQAKELRASEGALRLAVSPEVFKAYTQTGLTSDNSLYKNLLPSLETNEDTKASPLDTMNQGATAEQMAKTFTPPTAPIKTSTPVKEPSLEEYQAIQSAPKFPTRKEAKAARKPVEYHYSPSRNKTRVTYSDGSTELVDGNVGE